MYVYTGIVFEQVVRSLPLHAGVTKITYSGLSAVFGAILVSLVSGLCSNFISPKGSYEVLVVRRGG